ncbi:MAG: type II toxin-antitoxin system HicA family toxin [Candidatus Cryptobacteroides sp.]
MTWNEFKKLATSKGWQFYRHGSRHDIYRHPDRKDVMQIERHWSQEIRPGLQKKLLEQLEG